MNVKALLIALSAVASFACAAARHAPVPASAPVQALPAPTLSPAAAAASAVASATAPLPSDDVIALYNRALQLARDAAVAASAPADIAQATALYRQAAERFAPAAYELGMVYLEGKGVVPDPMKARNWFEAAAQEGQAAAMAALAMMANEGLSQPVDHALAWEWYRAIATSAHDQRLTGVRSLVSVYRNPNPSPYLPHFRQLFELADRGNPRAQDELGYLILWATAFLSTASRLCGCTALPTFSRS